MHVFDRFFFDPALGNGTNGSGYTVNRWLGDLNTRYGGIDKALLWPTYTNLVRLSCGYTVTGEQVLGSSSSHWVNQRMLTHSASEIRVFWDFRRLIEGLPTSFRGKGVPPRPRGVVLKVFFICVTCAAMTGVPITCRFVVCDPGDRRPQPVRFDAEPARWRGWPPSSSGPATCRRRPRDVGLCGLSVRPPSF
jgi:hypothetical protein